MDNKTVSTETNEAQEALNSIDEMNRAAMRRTVAYQVSPWIRLAILLLCGTIFIINGIKLPSIYLSLVLLLFSIVMIIHSRNLKQQTGVVWRPKLWKKFVPFLMVGVIIILIFVLNLPYPYQVSIVLGVMLIITGLIIFAVDQYKNLSKINAEKDK